MTDSVHCPWAQKIELLQSQEALSLKQHLTLALAYFNLGQFETVLRQAKKTSWKNHEDCALLRKLLITPIIQAKHYSLAADLLKLILIEHPKSLTDLHSLSSLLMRENKRAESCLYLEQIIALEPDNYSVVAQLIQQRYQNKHYEEAASLAIAYEQGFIQHERLLKIALLILPKANQLSWCVKKIAVLPISSFSLDTGILAAQLAIEAKDLELAKRLIDHLQSRGFKDARIHYMLAKIQLALGNNKEAIIEILVQGNTLDPNHVQTHALLGELLLKSGQARHALKHLEYFKLQHPKNPQAILLHARASKESGNYDEAADAMLNLIKLFPDALKWKRYAASALVQAGRLEQAREIFAESISLRSKQLPEHFDEALAQLTYKIGQVQLPKERFDWLWQMVDPDSLRSKAERLSVENQAKYLHLFDHLLIDWLECRPHQADEVMVYFEDLSEINNRLKQQLDKGLGVVLAGAHVGPLFAIPLALELLDFPHKWLASTPNIASIAYKDTLISTSEKTETEVVRLVMKALNNKEIAAFAVDGAISPSAPQCNFENQRVTYSDFAAKMVYRTKAPSFFISSYWRDNQIHLQLQALPNPLLHESLEDFCLHWRAAFLNLVKEYLKLRPDNARLNGGIWRHVS